MNIKMKILNNEKNKIKLLKGKNMSNLNKNKTIVTKSIIFFKFFSILSNYLLIIKKVSNKMNTNNLKILNRITIMKIQNNKSYFFFYYV